MENQEAATPIASNGRLGWIAFAISLVLMACLCGLAVGSILVSAGVSAYAGLTGVGLTQVAVTAVAGVVETQTPFPTYTFQPTYTFFPTYTPVLPPLLDTPTPPVMIVTATLPPVILQPTAPVGISEDIYHQPAEGETLETIAIRYGLADLIPVIYVNEYDRANPQIPSGEEVIIPAALHEWCTPPNEAVLAEVVSVVDGDTIEVSIAGQNYTVSYIGIDAPEAGDNPEPFASDALNANLELVSGQTITLIGDVSNANDESELPRYVIVNNVFVNYELARRGYAQAVPTPPDQSCDDLFALAAEQSQADGLGIWSGAPDLQQQVTPGVPTRTPLPSPQPTSTSSLSFDCHCWGPYTVWGNFHSDAEADACTAICAIQRARQEAACATAAAVGGAGSVGCR